MTVKKIALILLCLALTFTFVGCNQKSDTTTNDQTDTTLTTGSKTDTAASDTEQSGGAPSETVTAEKDKYYAVITVKDYGTISLELYANIAPITVKNFVDLANAGFYDGLTFHRVIEGFMIQGGDPKGNGTGGSDKNIKGEFASNGVKNNLKHDRGVISMARAQAPNSASSQFFIMHEDSPHLDGDYAAFGKVTDGMDVVDAIAKNTPVEDMNGTVKAKNQPVIESIKIVEKD